MNTEQNNTFNFEGKILKEDEEGYTQSFEVPTTEKEIKEAQNFFEEYGFIVFRNTISQEEVDQVKEDIFEQHLQGCDSEDVSSDKHWTKINWDKAYLGGYNKKRGFLGYSPASSQAAQDIRESEKMHSAFSTILRTNKLWYTIDRYGFMRPTKNVPKYDEETKQVTYVDKPNWKTMDRFIHWDLNPWKEQRFCRVQGVVAITDHTKTSGGFHCIPGFQHVIGEWAEANKHRRDDDVLVDFDSPHLLHAVRRITMRKGSVCIWDSRLPHGNWPNDDDKFRIVFYLTYFPALETIPFVVAQRQALVNGPLFHETMICSELGLMLAGLSKYTLPPLPYEDLSYINLDSPYNLNQWVQL